MIIIIFGLPGSGKSYFASRLAKKIGAKYVNSDRVRKELFAERDYSDQEKKIVYNHMQADMMQAVVQNNNLVLDATFHREETRKLFTDKIQNKEEIQFIEVQADEEIIRNRVSRKREYSDADFAVYKLILDENEPLLGPHLILQSTNENIDDMLKKAVHYLKTNYDTRANKQTYN